MASILSGNSLPVQQSNQFQQGQAGQQDPMGQINAIIQQILGSENPAAAFQQVVDNVPGGQDAIKAANQYGNGQFNRETFMNIAAAQGKQALAQQLMQRMGLG